MEFGSGFGGIALIILAAVWLLIFVPGWAKRSQIAANPDLVNDYLPSTTVRQIARTSQLDRLMRTRRIFSLILFSALVAIAGWFALPPVSTLGTWFVIVASVIALAATVMLIAANKTTRHLAVKRIATRNAVRDRIQQTLPVRPSTQVDSHDVSEQSGWQPNPLPAPLSAAKVGALITPRVADVIPIKAQEENSEQPVSRPSIELDEIMRRRRVI